MTTNQDVISEYQVLRSNAGFYIGCTYSNVAEGIEDHPYDRLSYYFKTRKQAEQELEFPKIQLQNALGDRFREWHLKEVYRQMRDGWLMEEAVRSVVKKQKRREDLHDGVHLMDNKYADEEDE